MERDRKAELAAYSKAWRAKNAERIKEQQRLRYIANREEIKARVNSHYHSLDPAEAARRSKRYREKNATAVRVRRKKDYADNRDRYIEQALSWKRENPLRWAHNMALERARRYGVEVSLTVDVWLTLVERFGGSCAYCGATGKCGVDHNIPLCRGGAHSLENVLPCCGPCNSSKNKRTPLEWLLSGVPRSRLIEARGCQATE